ncbi:MAG: SRPBCC family protein [Crocinitomicaceae bacterium]
MPKLHIEKSILVDKPIAEIYNKLNNYNHWTPWSPWIITDPDAKVTIAEDAKSYEWTGPVTGDGKMAIFNEVENERIDIDLTFLKPWKSTAKVWFRFKEEGQSTRVYWGMDSSLPFFLFFIKNMMTAMIGMDYDRGLNMFKEYAEEGKVNSELTFEGHKTFNGCEYVGIKTSTTIDKISDAMKKDYTILMEHIMDKHQDKVAGNAFSIYHKWDPVKNIVEYTAAVPVSGDIEMLPKMIKGSYPKTKVFTVHHKGPYKHVGNAWSAQYGRKQAKVIDVNKKLHPIEEYLNSPTNTAENELESKVHFAVK